ncbi:MAG: hypothetical protein JSR91_04855 [Proteobacteria bacterium]|nr:hypothetical protein [Pseudomonadota bacterium]
MDFSTVGFVVRLQDGQRTVRPAAALFLDRLARQRSMDDLVQCFPLQPLAVEAPLSDFHAFHGVM